MSRMYAKLRYRQAILICEDALDPRTSAADRLAAALEALAISADCCTSYTILAWREAGEEDNGMANPVGDPEGALGLHAHALIAGERTLRDVRTRRRASERRLFRRPGEFPEAVAYARSRLAYAVALHTVGRLEEAISHADWVIRAGKEEFVDPFGASHFLYEWLQEAGQEDEARELADEMVYVGRRRGDVFRGWPEYLTDAEISRQKEDAFDYGSFIRPGDL